jgi:hypothetical protein
VGNNAQVAEAADASCMWLVDTALTAWQLAVLIVQHPWLLTGVEWLKMHLLLGTCLAIVK